ncbi:MAG: lipopolysaccharide biosynthesis protein [Mariniblastus sp.]
MSPKYKQIIARFADGGWALAEQGTQSATNFLTVALIGLLVDLETLAVYQMGRFVILLLAGFQNSLISFPYTISFRTSLDDNPTQLAGSQLLLAIGLISIAVPVIALGLIFRWEQSVGNMIFALLFAVPGYLIREFFRRHDFAHLRTRTTFFLSLAMCLMQVLGMLLLWSFERLDAANVFVVIAMACSVTSVFWYWIRRNEFTLANGKQGFHHLKSTALSNWSIGKWIFSNQALTDLLLTAIQWALGSKAVGGMFAAGFQIVSLCNPVVMGLANLLPPKLAKTFAESGRSDLMETIHNFNKSFLVIVGGIAIGLVLFCEPLLNIVSQESVEHPYHLTAVLAAMMLVQAIGLPAFHGLNAVKEPFRAFSPRLLGIAVAIVFFGLANGWDSAIVAAYSLLIAHTVISTLTFLQVNIALK